MRQTEVSLSAAAKSEWVLHDIYQTPPAISLIATLSSGAVLTYSVQGTGDNLSSDAARSINFSQTTTTITVTDSGPLSRSGTHGLSVNDYVALLGGPDGALTEYSVASVVNSTTYTVTSATSRTASGVAQVISARVFNHAVLNALTANAQNQWAYPVKGSRLVVSAYTSGVASLTVLQGENK